MAASPGPNPKPTALRVLEGNPSKRPLPENEPEPQIVYEERPPSHLDREGKAEWRRMLKVLSRLGLYTELDKAALSAYCALWSRHVDAERNLQKFGSILPTPNGYVQASPYLSIANQALRDMGRALAEFGLSPSSRTRVTAASPPSGAGKWDDILD